MTNQAPEPIIFGERPLSIEEVLALSNRQRPTALQGDKDYRQRIAKARSSWIRYWTRKASSMA